MENKAVKARGEWAGGMLIKVPQAFLRRVYA